MRTELKPTSIPDLVVVETEVFSDERGYFVESWHAQHAQAAGLSEDFVQDNLSLSQTNVLRGLHYQDSAWAPMGKLVRCLEGEIFDVALDLRADSATYGHWYGIYLSGDLPQRQLWIPPGFAHGFYVTRGPAVVGYKCSGFYSKEHEGAIHWADPQLRIAWPFSGAPMVSLKDQAAESFADYSRRELEAGV